MRIDYTSKMKETLLKEVLFLIWQSIDQIGNRADRMRIHAPGLYLYSSTDIEVSLVFGF